MLITPDIQIEIKIDILLYGSPKAGLRKYTIIHDANCLSKNK